MVEHKFRNLTFSIRYLCVAIAIAAIGFAIWFNSTLSFRTDLSKWQTTPQWQGSLDELVGKRVHLLVGDDAPTPVATNVPVLSADLSDIADARITVRLAPWVRWRIMWSGEQVECSCPPFGDAIVEAPH